MGLSPQAYWLIKFSPKLDTNGSSPDRSLWIHCKKDMILAVAKCVALDAWLWHWKCNALLFEIQEKWTFLL